MAIIGICPASLLSISRIALAASIPFITGIITSIRIISKVPGGLFAKISTACLPSKAFVTIAPSSSRSSSAISILISLSSTRSTLSPCMDINPFLFSSTLTSQLFATSNGIVTIKVLPSPSLLSISIVPPIRSTRFFTMAIPKPVP